MITKLLNLLQGNFWIIDKNKVNFSIDELEFLKYFFNIAVDYDFENEKTKEFLILKKKSKFLSIH
jgi:hypothetical protein